MANGTRPVVLVLTLIVGLAIGWLIHGQAPTPPPPPPPTPTVPPPPPPPPPPTPVCPPQVTPVSTGGKDWKITVGPDDPCKVTDENGNPAPIANISKKKMHKLVFEPSPSTSSLAIIFHVPRTSPKPFKNLAFAGYDPQGLVKWLLYCDDPHKPCSTGPATADAEYGCYKYDQILDGKECDAGIIIEK